MPLGFGGHPIAVIAAVVLEILADGIDDFLLRRIAQRLAVEIIHRHCIQKLRHERVQVRRQMAVRQLIRAQGENGARGLQLHVALDFFASELATAGIASYNTKFGRPISAQIY
jgi:hypothetical protein